MKTMKKQFVKEKQMMTQLTQILMVTLFALLIISLLMMTNMGLRIYTDEKTSEAATQVQTLAFDLDSQNDMTNGELVDIWINELNPEDFVYDDNNVFNAKMIEYSEKYESDPNFDMEFFDELPKGQKKDLAALWYMFNTLEFDDYRAKEGIAYIYFIVPIEGTEDKWQFVISGKKDDEERGDGDDQIFKKGHVVTLEKENYGELYDARQKIEEFGFGDYVLEHTGSVKAVRHHVYYPVVQDDKFVGVVAVAFDIAQQTLAVISKIIVFLIVITIVIITTGLWIRRFMKNHILIPINRVQKSVDVFMEDLDSEKFTESLAGIEVKNEIVSLCKKLSDMGSSLTYFIEETTLSTQKEAKLQTELDLAAKIQLGALPQNFEDLPEQISLYAAMYPAKEVGGDFYDFNKLDDDHVSMVVGDVSGKGVPAALFMMISKILIKTELRYEREPAEILRRVNNLLCDDNGAKLFVTVWLGIYEISTGILRTANGGHEYPLIKRNDGTVEKIKDRHGLVLGMVRNVEYNTEEIQLNKGDLMVMYSDGVPEACDKEGNLFSMDRFRETLEQRKADTPREMIEGIYTELMDYQSETEQFDDITMLMMRA